MFARTRSEGRRGRRGRRGQQTLGLALLVVTGLAGAVVVYWRWPTLGQIERRWVERAGYDPREAFPAHEANVAAQTLDELVAPLGLSILPSGGSFRVNPPEAEVRRFDDVREDLGRYPREMRQPAAELAPPPPALARFLADGAPALRRIADALVDGEAPRWPLNVDRHEQLGADTLSHMHLERLLWSAAQQAAVEGRAAEARRWLDSAWRLTESLAESPETIDQIVADVELEDQLSLLRALSGPLPGWPERLGPQPLRRRMMTAIAVQLWRTPRFLHDHDPEGLFLLLSRPSKPLIHLQLRRGVAGVVDSVHRAVLQAADAGARPEDARRIFAEQLAELPRWNIVAQWIEPNALGLWDRAAHGELALELTRRTLELREALRSGDVAELAAGGEQPAVVAGVFWTYSVTPEAVTILATGDLPGSTPTYRIPLEVRVGLGPVTQRW